MFNDVNVESVDTTDGLRIVLASGNVIHFRPSGNAPELRCYAESSTFKDASDLVETALNNIQLMSF